MIEHLDTNIGRLLTALDELKLKERTLVIFTSDNGGLSVAARSRPLWEGRDSSYERGVHVPLVARWPGILKTRGESRVPVQTLDYCPTIAELALGTVPQGHRLDGLSMVPVCTGIGDTKAGDLFWHLPTYNIPYGRSPCAVVRRGEWKLVHRFGDYLDTSRPILDDRPYGRLVARRRVELFNLTDDGGDGQRVSGYPAANAEVNYPCAAERRVS